MPIRILLVDDHIMFREAVRSLIEDHTGMEVVGETGSGKRAINLARDLRPDVVIMDIGLHGMNGIEATREIIRQLPQVHVIGLSIHSHKRFVSPLLEAGAKGYLLKSCTFEELTEAIHRAVENRTHLSARVAEMMEEVQEKEAPFQRKKKKKSLTDREFEVLQYWVNGVGARETSVRLHLSMNTVETYRRHIKQKLGVDSLPDLIRHAVVEGFTTVDAASK